MNARQELLRRRLGDTRPSFARRLTNTELVPLSAAQHRMWLHQQLHPDSSAYNVCIQINLDGYLDEARLHDAVAAVVKRHDVLRTTYPLDTEGNPYQHINANLPPDIQVIQNEDPATIALTSAATPFDITTSSPIRIHLVRAAHSKWSLVLTVHHIVWDGGCFGIFNRDLSAFYRGEQISPLSIQYADANDYQTRNNPQTMALLDLQLDYWRRTLTPLPLALPLPSIRQQSAKPDECAERLDRIMPPASVTRLRAAAMTLRTTPFAIFITIYAVLLKRWTNASDITIATIVANRQLPGASDLIGNFGNTVLLRLDLSGDKTFLAVVEQASQVVTNAVSNSDVTYEEIVADIAPPREAGHGFFTETLGLFLDRDIGGPDFPNVKVQWSNIFNGASPFALTFQGFISGGEMRVEATFRSKQFAHETIHDMLEHFETILMAATANPDRKCSCISTLPPRQYERLIRLCTGEASRAALPSVLAHWRNKVSVLPNQAALVYNDQRYSYAEIDHCANDMATQLIAHGVGAGDIVAVVVSRNLATLTAPLAIWKCGAVYLPLDPQSPALHLNAILESSRAKVIISDGNMAPKTSGVPILVADTFKTSLSSTIADPGYEHRALDAAHISFTSGSTGRPKGVVTTHGSLAARTAWVAKHWPGGRGGARLAKSTPTAIDAIAELCEAIATDEYLVLVNDSEARDASALAHLLKAHSITHFMAVPGIIEAMAIVAPDIVGSCDRVLSTGEPLLPKTARAIQEAAKDVSLYNSYGCTETTGDVIAGRIHHTNTKESTIAIGNPLPGSRCHILSNDLMLTPPGVLGDLYIDSKQLAAGYLLQPGLTAASFVANPWGKGGRLYRTGDLARLRVDGQIELSGRSDDQINVRGHRVEPAETLAALYKFQHVSEAAVLAHTVGSTNALIAYIAGAELKSEDGPSIREKLKQLLPGPLVPADVIVMQRLPRLQGGKIDRKTLSDTTFSINNIETAVRAPRNEQEKYLTKLLAELLRRENIGIDDNFFACGGDSLLALTFAARANAAGLSFPVASIFKHRTVAQLVENGMQCVNSNITQRPLPYPTHRFRLCDISMGEFLAWYPLCHHVQPEVLHAAMVKVIDRHESLQQKIIMRGRLWRARFQPIGVEVIEISAAEATHLIDLLRNRIDPTKGPAIIAATIGNATVLFAHPLILDGLSLQKIAAEIDSELTIEQHPIQTIMEFSTTDQADWSHILKSGDGSPWWIHPEDKLSTRPFLRTSSVTSSRNAGHIIKTALQVALGLSGAETIVADVEVEPSEIGPLSAVPVAVHAGKNITVGSAVSYEKYLASHRTTAGASGILIRHTLAPTNAPLDCIPRGVDRLYRIVAAWERDKENTRLEVMSDGTIPADLFVNAWAKALSDQDENTLKHFGSENQPQ